MSTTSPTSWKSSPTAGTSRSPDPWQWFTHLVLPWISLAILYIGFYGRVLRANMLDAMNEDYVRTARAKGLANAQVSTRHVLRNSLIPVVTLVRARLRGAWSAAGRSSPSRCSTSKASASTPRKR